jgi:hypothetical protein
MCYLADRLRSAAPLSTLVGSTVSGWAQTRPSPGSLLTTAIVCLGK